MRIRLHRLAAVAIGVAVVGAAAPALAQDADAAAPRLVLRAVDARDTEAVKVVVSYGGDAGDLADLAVEVSGDAVDVEVADPVDADVTNDIVFVVDTSESTDSDGLLTEAKSAIEDFVGDLPAGTRVGLVGAGAIGQTIQRLTTDPALVVDGLSELTPDGQGGVLSGIQLAAGQLSRSADTGGVGSIVLFTDGAPAESQELDVARGRVLDAGAVMHTIGLDGDGFDGGPFQSLASATDGTAVVVAEPTAIGDSFDGLTAELQQVAVATFAGDLERGVSDISVTVGDSRADGSFVAGGRQVGPNRLFPRPGVEPSGPSFLRSDLGRYLAIGGVLVAAALLIFGLALVFVRDDTGLNAALQPYSEGYVARDGEQGGDEGNQALAQTALLRRAVEATESFAESQGFLTRVERQLEKADVPLRAGEAMFFYLAAVLLVLIGTLALVGNLLGALVVTLIALLLPPAFVNFRAGRKKKKFEALLPDTLQLLSSTLRAGYSMMQGVEAVSVEAEEPMGKELRRVVTEARLGRPLEESLEGIAERMESRDFAWAVMAIRIQREVGGNLSELLLTVAETMTERERLRREVSALTAEGRISAIVLGLLPIGLGGAIFAINPDYMGKLFEVRMGQIMLGGSLVAMAVGFLWMAKIIKIEL